jgi:DedD protein
MAWGNGKRGGDRVLESRHLVGLFLGVVLLCSVFFTLGYEMARTQYGGPVHAADSFLRPAPAPAAPAKVKESEPPAGDASANAPAGEWDFYSKKDDNHLEPAAKASAPSPASGAGDASNHSNPVAAPKTISEPVTKPPARFEPPKLVKGSVVLQLAALRRESDALAMADAVQQKKFPAFVVTPTADNLYRVQVGPYRDEHAAEAAQAELARAGFKAIVKR